MPTNRQDHPIVSIGSKSSLILLGLVLALLLAEFAARQLPGRPYIEDNGTLWECDRLVGWRGKRNDTAIVNTEGYIHKVRKNSAGMHDGEHSLEKGDNVFRILVMGDSFVEARQVEEAETSHQVLEEFLNETAPPPLRFEVISAGSIAWGPAQEFMYFRTEGKYYKPDLILGYWYPANDLMDILPDHRMTFDGTNCYAPYFTICRDEFDPEPWFSAPGLSPTLGNCSPLKKGFASMLNRVYFNSRLYQRLEPWLVKRQLRIKYTHNFSPWLEGSSDPTLAAAYRITEGIYTHLANEANEAGAEFALVIVPLKEAIYDEIDPAFQKELEAKYPELKNGNPQLPNQKLTELMAARNIALLDLQPAFVDYLKGGGGVLYGHIDSHWNVPGNQLAGKLIAQWLIAKRLVPADP
ncbi:MAG: hypothetical protein HS126_26665 [Anaerolineales bacterium]|nr:hypothetical protein [Anaerolineales bacterium]